MITKENERLVLMKKNKFDEHAQEVEEKTISCMGQIFASIGDFLTNELGSCLQRITSLLKNERTRLAAVKSLITISGSSLRINLSSVIDGTLQTLRDFLLSDQRDLKIVTLELIASLVENHTSP